MSGASLARRIAFDVVRVTFEDGAFTDVAFRRAADEAGLSGRERAQSQRLAHGAVQRRGTSDALIARFAGRSTGLLDPPVLAALRLGLYELVFLTGSPEHATVHQTVELARSGGAPHAAGLVNAVMRRATRERPWIGRLLSEDGDPAAAALAHSVPPWIAEMWWRQLGPAVARSLLRSCNEPPERAVRVNTMRLSAEELRRRFPGQAVSTPAAGWPLAAGECVVTEGSLAALLPLVESGELTPQSRGSAGVVEVLAPEPGEHVLDLCAGPGIKTGQLATRMEDRGEVISVERDAVRAEEIAAQAERLGLRSVTVLEADASEFDLGREFHRVLVDAPCSDLGTLASRPDARWRKSPAGIERLALLQDAILRRAARSARRGGVVVYATCTISVAENEHRVAALEAAGRRGEAPPMRVEDLGQRAPGLASADDPRCLQIRPDRDRTSGFFIARLRRDD